MITLSFDVWSKRVVEIKEENCYCDFTDWFDIKVIIEHSLVLLQRGIEISQSGEEAL